MRRRKPQQIGRWMAALLLLTAVLGAGGLACVRIAGPSGPSRSFGTPSSGRLRNGVSFGVRSEGLTTYSYLGWLLGRQSWNATFTEMPKPEDERRPPIETDPVIELYKQGIDRTLLRENLKRTPTERLEELVRLQRFAEEVARAGRRAFRR